MTPADRARALADVLAHSHDLEAAAQAERWDEALAVHDRRQALIAELLSEGSTPEQQRELARLIQDVLEADRHLLGRLEAARDAMAKTLADMQHGRSAVNAYRAGG
ncbi:MAG: flagellar protein FliT [Gammaproteobacteria bacterium]|nr:flagellar protein FliT [Gammaproteobacteria bacterium]